MKFLSIVAISSLTLTSGTTNKYSRSHELENYTFHDYLKQSGKIYKSEEEFHFRQEIFNKNLQKIKKHNSDPTKTWKMGVNKFTDMTDQELKYFQGGNKYLLNKNTKRSSNLMTKNLKDLPESVDWRNSDVVTAVKDQVLFIIYLLCLKVI